MTAKNVSLPALLSSDEIKLDQDNIRKTLTALDLQIHNNAVQCLMHCEQHRDTSLMVRLLTEIIDADTTGYRRQGLIAWMKYFSPMRLTGKTINMSGRVEHEGKQIEQSFDVVKALATPFWKLTREAEAVLRPMYQQGVMSQIDRAIKSFEEALANTVVGEAGKAQPIDKAKPYYKGKNSDVIVNFATEVKKLKAIIPADSTKDVDEAQRKQVEAAQAA